MATKTLDIDRRIPGLVGRLHRASGTTSRDVLAQIHQRIDDLVAARNFDVLQKLRDGTILPIELVRGDVDAMSARPNRPARVYVILRRDTGEVKIGFSRNFERRIRDLSDAHAVPLETLAIFKGGRRRELSCHRKFADLHIRGEWFRADPRLLEWAVRLDERSKVRRKITMSNQTGR